ncbi:hypothetical protein M378DRAFT_155107 [Amanita muscaria Koide BX008]|uniref:Uncharacterized protein n=1 Tax=Amanita muscaria (strain Koide BX008) TaxID=946122 RepID=A0A0C2XQR0_AMAMK|nr:hypothetical protein M378DRAFT_155107 [Amanita muscaria Koide BX008]
MELRVTELASSLEEKEAELRMMKQEAGDGCREEELMKRIEEDEAKIAALESMLRDAEDVHRLKAQMKKMEARLVEESKKLTERKGQCVDLVREKEEALDELSSTRVEVQRLTQIINDNGRLKRTKRIVERSVLVTTANAIVVSHLDFRNAQLQDQLQDKNRIAVRQADKILELETQLDKNTANLQAIRSQNNDIQSQLALKELQWEDELSKQNHSTRNSFEELERQVANLSRTLENVESERDSLSLQVTNLTSELQSVQQELRAAENRYSSLQFQQLSAMSTTEASRVLRDQLEEMEMRVARRTEQIGIHQHDIRRLETNLRLQEERLSEMTAELDTLAAQKDAMVEDCADAREARDAALSRVEALEMDLEASEAKLEQSDKTIVSAVAAFVQTVGTIKATMKNKDSRLVLQLNEAQALQLSLTKAVEEEKRTVAILHQCLEDSECGVRQLGIALALSRAEAMKATHSLVKARQEKGCLDSRVTELLSCIEQTEGHSNFEIETSRYEAARNTSRITELETQILEFQIDKEKKENEQRILLDEFSACKERLHTTLNDMEVQIAGKNTVEVALEEVISHHKQELNSLQRQLETVSHTVNELQAKLLTAEADKERMSADFASTQRDLEIRIHSMSADSSQDSQAKYELLSLKQEHEKGLSRLRDDLETANLDRAKTHERVKDMELARQQLADELASAHESSKAELVRMTEEARGIKEILENDLTLLHRELSKNSQELEKSSQENIRLSQELQRLTESHAQELTGYDRRIQSIETQWQSAEVALGELRGRVDVVTTELDSSRAGLEVVQKEKLRLQENMTNLEAELQRSASMTRYLESQLKEFEQSIETLTSDRDTMRAEFLQSEKSCNAAEVNLSLQSAQHKREMAELQKELDAIRSKPDLAAAVTELEERNNEMEELLRKKCAEIEENDDKVLEILKENKKLTAKVESLNRKVQNLQAKLSAAKASIPKADTSSSVPFPSAAPHAEASPAIQLRSSTIAESSVAPPKVAPVSGVFADRRSTGRAAPEATSVAKPKTPERRLAHPTVFKAKSPDKRSSATCSEPENTGQVIGKKRRAPDDFEAGDELPPQGFTVDSKPDDHNENRTPRVRRILSGGLTSFTPVRRSQTVQPSPKRTSIASVKSSSLIADVTNSPRMSQGTGKNAKRGWLGKIRHATNTTPRIASSMTHSKRPDEYS